MSTTTTLAFAVATVTASICSADDTAPTPPPATKFTPGQVVDALHAAFGKHPARAVHAKGVIVEGVFTPDAGAAALTKAAHLQKTASKVTLRFSNFTGIPDIADNNPGANPRGIAIRFALPGGVTTDIVGHSFNGFPTATSDEFRELLMAIAASGPTVAKPTPVDKFLAAHPIAKTFLTTQKTPASYATLEYFGVNSFKMTNAAGSSKFIRYQVVPEEGAQAISADDASKRGAMYLQDELAGRVSSKPFRLRLYAQVAEATDKIADPSIAWPDTRTKVLLGTITITALGANTPEQDQALAFSPNNLTDGIKTADPMLEFRAKAYPISVQQRR
jgi:catalase